MGVGLVVAGLALATVDSAVFAVAWRGRAALSGVAAVAGAGAGLAAAVTGGDGSRMPTLIVASLVLGGLGACLFVLGQLVQRLLDETPEGEA